MKKTTILSSLLLLTGILAFSACSSSTSSSNSSVGGELQDSNSMEFDPFTSSTPESSEDSSDTSSSEDPIPETNLGTWLGEDVTGLPVCFTVTKDSAVLSFENWDEENEEYHFTFKEIVPYVYTIYLYTCDEDAEINIEFMLYNETYANFASADREDLFISDLFIPNYGIEFYKQ